MKSIISVFAMFVMLAVVATGCEKETFYPGDPQAQASNEGTGTLKVKMTDAPGNFDALRIEVERVEVYSENSGWITLNSQAQTISVLDLTNGTTAALNTTAGTEVEAGTYTMVKIVLNSEKNELVLDGRVGLNGVFIDTANLVELEYGGPQEIIIEVDREVKEGEEAEILLDFDAAASVQQRLSQGLVYLYDYYLDPVVRFVDEYGTGIRGDVTGTAGAAIKLSGTTGEYSTFIDATGQFLIEGVEEGEYDLEIIPEMVGGELLSEFEPITIENVFITEGNILTMGTISASN